MMLTLAPAWHPLTRWARSSQRTACRNAMVASTALAASRREREETQDLVQTLIARRAGTVSAGLRRYT